MGQVLKLVKDVRTMSDLPATLNQDQWSAATEAQRRIADLRCAFIKPLSKLVEGGASINNVSKMFVSQCMAGMLDPNTSHVMRVLGTEAVSVPTVKRWISAYTKHGKNGLLPQTTGRVRKDYGWEARAVELYNIPSKPGFADVAFNLIREGFEGVTESRVKRYLKALPATLGEHSPARVGKHLHKLKRQAFQRRSTEELLVGELYAGDGHTVDCYVAHPNTGKPYRPELTAFIDVKSRFIAGWWLSESESANSTLFALSNALVMHDHVPAWVYIDQGPGYRSKLLADECTGWYARFSIEVIGAIPGNPHGKGWIERWFRTMRNKHDKFFADGQVYCGDDMAPEINRRMSADVTSGKRKLPSYYAYVESFREFLEAYHHAPMDVLDGRTPAQVWAEMQRVTVGLEADAVMRPRHKATVQRQTVRLHNRFYWHEALALYDAKEMVVEYDLHRDGVVWVLDDKGRLVCEASLVKTIGVLPSSRLEEQRDKRLAGQRKRLERKLEEATARRQDAITADDQVRGIEALERALLPTPDTTNPLISTDLSAASVVEIDLLDWRNKDD